MGIIYNNCQVFGDSKSFALLGIRIHGEAKPPAILAFYYQTSTQKLVMIGMKNIFIQS
jgi:hypothetical protein